VMTLHVGTLPELPPQARTILLIGRRTSDHLQELVRMAEMRNRAAYRIESAAELQPRWFAGVEDVGLVIGAEGLDEVVAEVRARLEQFSAVKEQGMLEGVAR
jgi:4-hydroxy-3-methylbut-2-enyl diphosphate reductase